MAFDASGNMYWTYLISLDVDGDGNRELADGDDLSVVVQQVNPQTGALIGNAVDVTPGAHTDDKQWIASDANPASPFANNIYLVWTRLDSGSQVMFSRSINNGTTFSAAQDISTPHGGNGFVWPSHLTVAMNGDLYTTWHNDTGGSANATVSVLRDSTGGLDLQNGTVVQSSTFNAAVTTNVQTNPSAVPQTNFWTQGSSQPYILTDPIRPGMSTSLSMTIPTMTLPLSHHLRPTIPAISSSSVQRIMAKPFRLHSRRQRSRRNVSNDGQCRDR